MRLSFFSQSWQVDLLVLIVEVAEFSVDTINGSNFIIDKNMKRIVFSQKISVESKKSLLVKFFFSTIIGGVKKT